MAKSVRFFTVGCKVNQYETQSIRESFLRKGYKEAGRDEPADVFVVNTCTVTSKADRDSRRLINLSRRINPRAEIVVTGCLAEKDKDNIRAIPGVTRIMKNSEKPAGISGFYGRSRAFVKIQDGCNNFCSYCRVPLVRGRSRSRDLESIVEEARRLVDNGFKELVLCGICLGAWGKDLAGNWELTDIIDKIDSIKGDFRIRLSSIEPNLVSDRLIKKMAESSRLCNHLHIPLQSGDDRILKLMNRPYTSRDFVNLIAKIRKSVPDFSLTTDVLVGFPGEKKRYFINTVKIVKAVMPSRLHIFSYSRRRGTRAYDYIIDVSKREVGKRTRTLSKIGERLSYRFRRRFLNKIVRVLIEKKQDKFTQPPAGYTDTYIRVNFADTTDSFYGQLIYAKVVKADSKSTFCISLTTHP